MIENGILRHQFVEDPKAPFRLGRHLELDARSLGYTIEAKKPPIHIQPVDHSAAIPTLDQGQLGSCTGNAGTYHAATLAYASGVGAASSGLVLNGHALTTDDAKVNEQFAVELYHEATVDDGFPGTYPPDDTGSSGLGVCKALKAAGLIKHYTWATTLHGFGVMLQTAGVIIGTPWYNAWFNPDSNGFIDEGNWQASGVAGGHEIYVEALEVWNEHDPAQSVVRFHNSWSDSWGDHGCGRMHLSTYVTLRSQIDIKQFSI